MAGISPITTGNGAARTIVTGVTTTGVIMTAVTGGNGRSDKADRRGGNSVGTSSAPKR
jgi:hypothetical protein